MRCLILAMMVCALSGCITTDQPLLSEPRLDQGFQKKNEPLTIYYYAGFTVDSTRPAQLALLRRVFEKYVADQVATAPTPPARGLYISVYERSPLESASFMERLSEITLWLIPSYKAG